MGARELFAAGRAGGSVRIRADGAAGGVVLESGALTVTLSGILARLFQGLLEAPGPLDKAQLKALVWKTQALHNATVQNAITALRGALAPLFDNPVAAAGNPARYALAIGLPPDAAAVSARALPSHRWPARLIVCASQALCCGAAAALSLHALERSKGAGIILPTGRTAGEVFHSAIALAAKRRFLGLEAARYFIDVETLGVGPQHAASRQAFVRKAFFEPLRIAGYRIAEDRVAFFPGTVENEASHFERVLPILRATPLAAHLVSVSPEGNLVGYSAGETRRLDDIVSDDCTVQTLSEADRRYIDARLPSRAMLSIGLLNMLRADTLVVPVYHQAKAEILRALFRSAPDAALPATLLKLHTNAAVITTRALAGKAVDREDVVEIGKERDINEKLELSALA